MNVLDVLTRGLLVGEQVLKYQGQNIANMNTPAYQSVQADFGTFLNSESGGGVSFARSEERGSYVATGGGLDIYLQPGVYFAVQDDTGIAYSRFGRLRVDADNGLVDANGKKLLLDGAITQQVSGDVTISSDGGVFVGGGRVATLSLSMLGDSESDMDGYVRHASELSILPDQPILTRGFEASNVNFTDEVVALMVNVRQMNGLHYAYKSIESIYEKTLTDLGRF
ncbi:hypothetical protein ACTSKR_08465 [Chitinibacteraceae bacterium HSL-7]